MRTRLPRPYASNAALSRGLGVFSLTLLLAVVLWRRTGVLDLQALSYLGLGVLGAAALAVLLAVVAAAQILRNSARGFRDAVAGFSIGGFVLVLAGMVTLGFVLQPRVNLVTTEPALIGLERDWLRPLDEINPGGGDLDLYSDILPLQLDTPPESAFAAAETVLAERGWRLVERVTPAEANGGPARLRAVAQSAVLGFFDDVLVRITPLGVGVPDPAGAIAAMPAAPARTMTTRCCLRKRRPLGSDHRSTCSRRRDWASMISAPMRAVPSPCCEIFATSCADPSRCRKPGGLRPRSMLN